MGRGNRPQTEDSLLREIAWAFQRDAFEDEVGKSLMAVWSSGEADREVKDMIRNRIHSMQTRELFGELTPFRIPPLRSGQLVLGRSLSGRDIRFFFSWLVAGLLIVGNTGASKTNLVKHLILQIATHLRGLWVSDLYKKEMRHLRPLLARMGIDWIILQTKNMRFNLLQADGVDPRMHLAMALDILGRNLALPSRAMTILRAVCHQLYEEFGIFNGKRDHWPTLFDVYERILAAVGLNAAAKEALLDRLAAFLTALTAQAGAWRLGWKASDLRQQFLCLEMLGSQEAVKSVNLNHLLFSTLYRLASTGAANRPMDSWCIFEDAQRFFGTRGEGGDLTPGEEIAGVIRGTGAGIAFTAQTLVGLPAGLLPNLSTKIMGRLGGHSDYQALGADLGMNPEQIQWAKLNLQPGLLIAQFAEGPWRHPFPFHVDKIDVPNVVDDAEAERSLQALAGLPTKFADEFRNWSPRFPGALPKTAGLPAQPSLTEVELRFLQAVVDLAGRPSGEVARAAGLSGKRAAEIRRRLVDDGYVAERELATGNRGRNAIVLEPLENAVSALNSEKGGN